MNINYINKQLESFVSLAEAQNNIDQRIRFFEEMLPAAPLNHKERIEKIIHLYKLLLKTNESISLNINNPDKIEDLQKSKKDKEIIQDAISRTINTIRSFMTEYKAKLIDPDNQSDIWSGLLAEQKQELLLLLATNALKNKKEEIAVRKLLIQKILNKSLTKELAAQFLNKINELVANRTEARSYDQARELAIKKNRDIASGSFKGLITNLGVKIATTRNEIKKKLAKRKEEGVDFSKNPLLLNFEDKCAKAVEFRKFCGSFVNEELSKEISELLLSKCNSIIEEMENERAFNVIKIALKEIKRYLENKLNS